MITRTSSSFRPALAAGAAGMLLASCGGGDGGSGTLRLSLTDAPACGYDHVWVTVERVRVHSSSSAQDGDGGWSEVVLAAPKRIDLLDLTNGRLEELGETVLPAGKYTQMRLALASNAGGGATPANAVQPTGGAVTPLTTPSGTQTGLKMNVDVDVPDGQVVEAVIDFDACKSVVRRGNSGQYNLQPVLAVTTVLSSVNQRVEGYVTTALGNGNTAVSLQAGGVVRKATVPDASGKFVLFPVPVGQYDLVVTAPGRVNAVMTGVPVTTTAITTVSTIGVRIDPPASALQRTASGTVRVAGSSAVPVATVRALQSFALGPTVEIVQRPIDGLTGGYSYSLPVEAPVKVAYMANPGSLPFAADPSAAGEYRLEALSEGRTTQMAEIDLTAAAAAVDFTFP